MVKSQPAAVTGSPTREWPQFTPLHNGQLSAVVQARMPAALLLMLLAPKELKLQFTLLPR